jgi:hypothetical protein
MNTLREAAQQAEAVLRGCLEHPDAADAITTIRAALAEPEPYDQQALELCEECGWKTLIPTEGCLNCERQPKAEPQKPVGTYAEVMQTMRSLQTGTLEQQQAFALLKDKPLYAEPQPKAEQEPVNIGPEWTPCVKLPVTVHVRHQRPGETHVSTREGITPVKPDDLIMRGVSGEEYPIGREIFERTYQLGEAPQPKAWYGVSPMFGTVTFDSYQDALDAGFDNPLPLIEAAAWGDGK